MCVGTYDVYVYARTTRSIYLKPTRQNMLSPKFMCQSVAYDGDDEVLYISLPAYVFGPAAMTAQQHTQNEGHKLDDAFEYIARKKKN